MEQNKIIEHLIPKSKIYSVRKAKYIDDFIEEWNDYIRETKNIIKSAKINFYSNKSYYNRSFDNTSFYHRVRCNLYKPYRNLTSSY